MSLNMIWSYYSTRRFLGEQDFQHQSQETIVPSLAGNLASGDCKKNIHIWKIEEGGKWLVDQRPYAAHSASVEDIQWSPNEKTVMNFLD